MAPFSNQDNKSGTRLLGASDQLLARLTQPDSFCIFPRTSNPQFVTEHRVTVTFPINLQEETAGGVGKFNHRSRGKSIRQKGISLKGRDWFGEENVHGMGKNTLGSKRLIGPSPNRECLLKLRNGIRKNGVNGTTPLHLTRL